MPPRESPPTILRYDTNDGALVIHGSGDHTHVFDSKSLAVIQDNKVDLSHKIEGTTFTLSLRPPEGTELEIFKDPNREHASARTIARVGRVLLVRSDDRSCLRAMADIVIGERHPSIDDATLAASMARARA